MNKLPHFLIIMFLYSTFVDAAIISENYVAPASSLRIEQIKRNSILPSIDAKLFIDHGDHYKLCTKGLYYEVVRCLERAEKTLQYLSENRKLVFLRPDRVEKGIFEIVDRVQE